MTLKLYGGPQVYLNVEVKHWPSTAKRIGDIVRAFGVKEPRLVLTDGDAVVYEETVPANKLKKMLERAGRVVK